MAGIVRGSVGGDCISNCHFSFFVQPTVWSLPLSAFFLYSTTPRNFGEFDAFFFLITQLIVNSKKNIGGSAAGKTKRIEKKKRSFACFL